MSYKSKLVESWEKHLTQTMQNKKKELMKDENLKLMDQRRSFKNRDQIQYNMFN